MPELGVMEIFFGSPWAPEARLGYADFLAAHGFASYLYGPKADANLRRRWREDWSAGYAENLGALSRHYRERGLAFGVCLSPLGYHEDTGLRGPELLRQKLDILNGIGIDTLGLFFDDMPVHPALAETQLAAVRVVQAETDARILFCPSFYSPDPILDKVFGARPAGYLEALGAGLPAGVEIAWTGPKVISPEIPAEHLAETARRLKRAPSICDNFFANDGPKNCKFLKLKSLSGRSAAAFAEASSWYFNPMNEPWLSRIALRAAKGTLGEGQDPGAAWSEALAALCSEELAGLLLEYREDFSERGLDGLDPAVRAQAGIEFAALAESEPAAAEVQAWLGGAYTVGSECLTD